MNFKQLEKEIEAAELALFHTETIEQWDRAVRRYNELKIKWYQMSGESPMVEVIQIADFNLHKAAMP